MINLSQITIISGSPSALSRTDRVLHYLGNLAEQAGYTTKFISVKDIDAHDLLFANFNIPKIKEITHVIEEADGVIVGSPVYKSSYSGVLKALFDLLPQDVLQDTFILPVMIGGSSSHLLALEYTLKPLLATFKGYNLKGLYYQDKDIGQSDGHVIINEDVLERTKKQLDYFLKKVEENIRIQV